MLTLQLIVGRSRLMCHDPKVYLNPEEFNPDRFLGDSPEPDPQDIVFGFGRRVCPGRRLAEASLLITFAMSLWAFDLSPIEVDGMLIPPEYKPTSGAIWSVFLHTLWCMRNRTDEFISRVELAEMRVTPRVDVNLY